MNECSWFGLRVAASIKQRLPPPLSPLLPLVAMDKLAIQPSVNPEGLIPNPALSRWFFNTEYNERYS
jgi:hypothetical protein